MNNKNYSQNYYLKHRKAIRLKQNIYMRVWRKKNKDKIKRYKSNYDIKHKKQINNYYKKYQRIRRKNDSAFKILTNLRNRVHIALKGNPKLETTMKLVGCSIEKLRVHLQHRFKRGMNWGQLW